MRGKFFSEGKYIPETLCAAATFREINNASRAIFRRSERRTHTIPLMQEETQPSSRTRSPHHERLSAARRNKLYHRSSCLL